ncbi:M24 family metallopeptidase [Chrysiogenes arsenatis]|uniref:M24 family metallopeptidase n=1 Tax=Chrysiogenes arsenatis TaxID=309797 RepID=UPI0004037B53|nr:Xaa-Pro peptidase family protein [Chrysiogenes arsenatis]
MITRTEAMVRVAKLQSALQGQKIDGALFQLPIDIYYFSGTRQNGVLWVPAEGVPILLVKKSYTRACQESPLEDIRPFPPSKEFAATFPESVMRIGLSYDILPVQQQAYYSKLLPGKEFCDISLPYRDIRSEKTPFELQLLTQSAKSLCSVFEQVPQFLKAGMREVDVAAEFEYRLRKAGNEGYIRMRAFNQELFMGLALSAGAACEGFFDGAVTGRGLTSAAPHGSGVALIQANEPIFIDYTGVFNGYITDMTRMFVIGTLDAELKRAFDVSLAIQKRIQELLIPGNICEDLFSEALAMANQEGLGESFMGMPGEQAKFVAHGVGLELDELPVLAQGFKVPLRANQVVAVEPKFVLPGRGAIGIENTFIVTEKGGVKITAIPDEIVYLA